MSVDGVQNMADTVTKQRTDEQGVSRTRMVEIGEPPNIAFPEEEFISSEGGDFEKSGA